jgi:cyclase
MFRPRVIPVLLLKYKGLVKTIQFKKPKYIGDPMNAVKIFNDMEADELIFLDITASQENRIPAIEIVQEIGDEAFMPFAVGGGIKTLEHIQQIIKAGAEKVVINSACITNPEVISDGANLFGRQSIIASIDIKKTLFGKQKVHILNGKKNTKLNAIDHAVNMESLGAGEIFINSVDQDGEMTGYDLALIKEISEAVKIPVVASGGAGSIEDMKQAINNGASAASAGSMFVYKGSHRGVLINYPDKEELKNMFN